jgi:hypothetical protein
MMKHGCGYNTCFVQHSLHRTIGHMTSQASAVGPAVDLGQFSLWSRIDLISAALVTGITSETQGGRRCDSWSGWRVNVRGLLRFGRPTCAL